MYDYIIKTNERLKFRDWEKTVSSFVRKRLGHYGASSIIFVSPDKVEDAVKQIKTKNHIAVVCDIMNPLIDYDIIEYAGNILKKNNLTSVRVDGAVPGTQFEYMTLTGSQATEEVSVVRVFVQDKYNNQFNLYKYKRLKQFIALIKSVPNLYKMSIDEIMIKIEEPEILSMLIGYGTDANMGRYNACPYCGGTLISLPIRMSQPFCGYIPASRPLYHQCVRCSLTVLSPYIKGNESYKMYDDFDTRDFMVSKNNPYHIGTTRCDLITKLSKKLPSRADSLDLGGVLEISAAI